jgi:hypothetical protein
MKILPVLHLFALHLQFSGGFVLLGGAAVLHRSCIPFLEHGSRADIVLRATVLRVPARFRHFEKWFLSGSSANDGGGLENSEESNSSELRNFDTSRFSAFSENAASASLSDSSWKKLSKIYVLLFNARTDNEGICELKK